MNDSVDHRLRGSWTPEGASEIELAPKAVRWLAQRIGECTANAPVAPDSAMAVAPSRIPEAAHAKLVAIVGEEHVLDEAAERLGRSGGLSYLDLLRRRYPSSPPAVPDAVVLPGDPEQVQRVLDVCVEHDIGVVPFGGGTSVVGGVTALRGDKDSVLVLDLERLDRLVSVDPVSRVAVLQAGVRGPDAERLLSVHGLTLGHVPQSFERATIGGFAATRSAGQASSGYGRFEDMVTGLRLATPRGEWRLGVAPASAAGPDLRQLAIGSEGTLGVITEVAVRVRPLPERERFEAFALDGWERGTLAVRHLAQRGLLADVTRLSDVDETASTLALAGSWKTALLRRYLGARGIADPCLLILGWYGDAVHRRREAVRSLRAAGAVGLGTAPGHAWLRNRFAGPRQRDALLDLGVCVETLETAAHWGDLGPLYERVRAALHGALDRPHVLCHVSHAYETGASLYFTVLATRDEADPIGQWERAKRAASEAIAGDVPATITHHHAIGTDHAPYLAAEIGELGVDVLRAAKSALDPTGILNPGKLLPPQPQ
ncbi:FAD-binding oxidoreductase [Prauserella sp. PE36]|uniref:FAD-binding oxidoreductase n=1 Tax=Prauserella endophytica TaxID=1592324 RepID=A0ABY2S1K8_9PSEU|nr:MULTISPECIES: FAD-binding oxidoreductase [Prauserella]RBM10374.1 FAD-binding oxidoreductase [Prauserella sp. PE36]TKG68386.1 FAD-binding oxidoreductase [Prauserella endophytica]